MTVLMPKERKLTIKEQAIVEGKLKGMGNTELGMMVFNTTKPKNADSMVRNVLGKPKVQNEIERRMAAQQIFVDRHLKNIDKLAFSSEKDDVRLRASQDLADRAGAHYKYHVDNTKVNIDVELSDEQFNEIISKYAQNERISEGTTPQIIEGERGD